MHKHVVVNSLVRVRRVVHKHEVARIARHKQVSHAVDRTLVQTPTHIAAVIGSRKCQMIKIFLEEILAHVNEGDHLGLHLSTGLIRLNLHDTRTAEHENRLGIRVVSTAVRTFERVNQDGRTQLGNHGIANFAPDGRLVCAGHLGPGCIGDVAEIGARPAFFLVSFVTRSSRVGICLATTTVVVGIREERITVLVPNKRGKRVVFHSIRTFGDKMNVIAVIREILGVRIILVYLGREPVERARNTRRPEPFLGRVHHQVPKAVRISRRQRSLYDTTSSPYSFAHLMNVLTLRSNKQVSIGMVHDAIGSTHPVFLTAKRILLQQL